MTISYAITVCNEVQEFKKLLDFLVPKIRKGVDEIVILYDVSKNCDEVPALVSHYSSPGSPILFATGQFEGHFADWKNKLPQYCSKDYIFQIDADECPSLPLVEYLPKVLEINPEVDLLLVPRANTVEGITADDIRNWHWNVTEMHGHTYINWPDYQSRIYRNVPQVHWEGKVHERIVGFDKWAKLPDSMFLYHNKEIQKQRAQNAFYNQLIYGNQ